MKNWTIRQRLLGSFGLLLALVALVGSIAFIQTARVKKQAVSASTDSVPGLYNSMRINSDLAMNYALSAESVSQTDVLATEKLEQRLKANQASLNESTRRYEQTIVRAQDRADFDAFKDAQASYANLQQQLLQLNADLKFKEANQLWREQLDPAFEKARAAIQVVVDLNKASADRSMAAIMDSLSQTVGEFVVDFVVMVGLIAICAHHLIGAISKPLARLTDCVNLLRTGDFSKRVTLDRRDEFHILAEGFNRMTDELAALVGQVQNSSGQVNTSVNEIAATSKQQQATANSIAVTTMQIGATSKEISATAKELVATMSEVSHVAEQSATLAGSGQTGLSHMEETMRQVMEAAGSINAKLAVLNEKASNINQVVVTITKVADQTNLLSLNAAIEAEKAGEYGRGFAVVATEIRRLADQTAVATYDIEQMVKQIQSAVAAGVMGMDKFSEEVRRGMEEVQQVGGQLSQIIHQVQALAPRVESVNEGMQAQATGAEQISQALTQLTEAAQQTVESLSQSSFSIDELNKVSSNLRSGVSRFRLHQDAPMASVA